MTLHTNTHNCMHMLMHTSPCSCDCTGATSAHTSMYIQAQHLHLAPLSPTHAASAPQSPRAASGVSRAPACTHTTHTLRARQTQFVLQLAVRRQWTPSWTCSQTRSRDRHTPHPTKEPLCTPSPSAPHTLRQTERQGTSHWS